MRPKAAVVILARQERSMAEISALCVASWQHAGVWRGAFGKARRHRIDNRSASNVRNNGIGRLKLREKSSMAIDVS